MQLYRNLSQIKFLKKSYAFKFLFVAFIGIHIPLIGILLFVLYGRDNISSQTILLFALFMTLLATAVTLCFLKHIIKPIAMASKALENYRNERMVPNMPTQFKDEAGLLMNNIQKSILENEQFINDKQDLIYLLSHDFKNFTGNSQGLAELILAENPSTIVQEYAELILESTHQQFTFIEIFINLIKDEDEILNRSFKSNNIQFSLIFNEVHNKLNQKLKAKKITLIATQAINEAKLYIEDDLLIRVLINLVDNAIKFSFSGSKIELKVHIVNDKIHLSVLDSRIGFNPKIKDELYKKFTNRGRIGTANEPSTGIGLYVCKKIVEKYKGSLSLTGEGVNQGTAFSIIFNSIS